VLTRNEVSGEMNVGEVERVNERREKREIIERLKNLEIFL